MLQFLFRNRSGRKLVGDRTAESRLKSSIRKEAQFADDAAVFTTSQASCTDAAVFTTSQASCTDAAVFTTSQASCTDAAVFTTSQASCTDAAVFTTSQASCTDAAVFTTSQASCTDAAVFTTSQASCTDAAQRFIQCASRCSTTISIPKTKVMSTSSPSNESLCVSGEA